jgi:hypothetical protein
MDFGTGSIYENLSRKPRSKERYSSPYNRPLRPRGEVEV